MRRGFMQEFENAFRQILSVGYEIEPVANCDYLYEINGKTYTEEEVIAFANNMKGE